MDEIAWRKTKPIHVNMWVVCIFVGMYCWPKPTLLSFDEFTFRSTWQIFMHKIASYDLIVLLIAYCVDVIMSTNI